MTRHGQRVAQPKRLTPLLRIKGAAFRPDQFQVCVYQLCAAYGVQWSDKDEDTIKFWSRLAYRLMVDYVPAFQRPRKIGAPRIHRYPTGPTTILASLQLEDSRLLVERVRAVAKSDTVALRVACDRIAGGTAHGTTIPFEFEGCRTGGSLFQAYKRAVKACRVGGIPLTDSNT
jgi:hypothetical protein